MTARSAARGQGFVAAALARAEAWLLAPEAGPDAAAASAEPPEVPPSPQRPVVAVVGLAPRCGATTVARALAVELALRDPCGAAVVVSERPPAGAPLPPAAGAARIARRLRALGFDGARSAGRLCLVGDSAAVLPLLLADRPAPLVIDGGRDGRAAAVAEHSVLVAGPQVEPALALVVSASLERAGRIPAVLANRVEDAAVWEPLGAVAVGESRLAATLALAGREPRGALGAAVRELVDRWEAEGE